MGRKRESPSQSREWTLDTYKSHRNKDDRSSSVEQIP